MKSIVLLSSGLGFTALGFVGILIPILPGFLFFLLAAACFAQLSPTVRRNLGRHPRMARFFNHLDAGTQLDLVSRIKLAFWAGLDALNPKRKTKWSKHTNNRSWS